MNRIRRVHAGVEIGLGRLVPYRAAKGNQLRVRTGLVWTHPWLLCFHLKGWAGIQLIDMRGPHVPGKVRPCWGFSCGRDIRRLESNLCVYWGLRERVLLRWAREDAKLYTR